ncbi:putative two-component sensor [Vibrio ichthyoenteri ATCC 700023]|uniref:histidine kinase n=1 Tax=Vibrio ichthyoenteri ATCC 700023 TaxID=870968 RepID=F9RXT7_9VIBR|nr:HAMP domain-containing sensor histidine kinase [Vibrio ichthyoenteri]EGU47468.1 putative two-component sensor [Vibrio ichthyoenteri ATCC 700023]
MNHLLNSTRSLIGRLAVFFIGISIALGMFTLVIFSLALHWSEDRVGERRILLDKDIAIERFVAGENGKIKIDILTTAYNDLSLLPKVYQHDLSEKSHFLGELEPSLERDSRMVYKGQYTDQGQLRDIVLLTTIDTVEFSAEEVVYSSIIVVTMVALLMFLFGTLLYRLSKRLIEPLNGIVRQLEQQSGDSESEFTITNEAAEEFQVLTQKLNQYRNDLNLALKREQAFARYASHELRTPLTVVKGAGKLLARTEQPEFNQRQIARIENATTQMSTMVDALLGLVRYERNTNDAPKRMLNNNELNAIVADNSLQAHDKDLNINLLVESLPQVQASPPVMNMILGNLIRNAIAATVQGEVTIYVSTQMIEITDDGPGLSNQPNKDGHGLGLLIVDDLSRRYQWAFELKNHSTRGCVAKITF